ncbi:MAG TPA: DUF4142 domain-containing protein [Polyangiaceae bacterium]|nr:DUF4142 domain-containing protein [Polyangiaceae bacterium]
MRFKYYYAFLLLLPLAAQTSCSDDDDTSSSGGSGGRAQAGSAGRSSGGSGGRANTAGSPSAGSGGRIDLGGGGGFDIEAGSGGTTEAGAGGEAGEAGAGGALETALDDSEIVKVVTALNDAEIAAGQVALAGAQAAAVKAFAQTMVTDHGAANAQVLALVSTRHIAPRPSPLSYQLESEGAALLVTLSATSSAAFDATYIDSQIRMHQEALGLIDSRLIPAASDTSLKTLLGNVRTSVETHLTLAQTVHASL